MFVGSVETAKKVLRSRFGGLKGLSPRYLHAGGPGSGCHGPNCGRPEGSGKAKVVGGPKAAGLLKQYNWKRLAKWKGGETKHGEHLVKWRREKGQSMHVHIFVPRSIYKRGLGQIEVSNAGFFRHLDRDGNIIQEWKPNGKFGANLKQYLESLQNLKDVEVMKPPAPKAQEPTVPFVPFTGTPEEKLKSLEIRSSTRLGGGINMTKKVVFADGSFGVFKIDTGKVAGRNITPGKDNEREVAAWEVAKLVGMQDMVAPAAIRNLDGQKGALLLWQDGDVAWQAEKPMYDSKEGAQKAAAFDYVIGNTDRHDGNWVVSKDGNLHLIDHGLAFPEETGYARGSFVDHIRWNEQEYDSSPKVLAEPYVKAQPQIIEALQKLQLPPSALDGVRDRIQILSKAEHWKDLVAW